MRTVSIAADGMTLAAQALGNFLAALLRCFCRKWVSRAVQEQRGDQESKSAIHGTIQQSGEVKRVDMDQ